MQPDRPCANVRGRISCIESFTLHVQLTVMESDDLGEADPSRQYSEEQELLEPAESLASQIHREEEAHRAAATLSAAAVAAEDYKLTKYASQKGA